jgi:ribosome-associated translation inhibitor RaiA
MRAEGMDADAYVSASQAADNLEKQLRRYHRKMKDHHAGDEVAVPEE